MDVLSGNQKLSGQIDILLGKIPEWQEISSKLNTKKETIDTIVKTFAKDKKYFVREANAAQKILNAIPAEEITQAVQKIINIAIENPEKFAKFIQEDGALKQLLMTPELKRALTIVGISWGVFCTGLTFTVQSYFAKLQKEAGRLGVMKAMEELQDDRIYADENPKQKTSFQSTSLLSQQKEINNNKNLPQNIQNLLNSTKNNKDTI